MYFRFTQIAIDTERARQALEDFGAGGYVSFEGWVRDHNEGQEVTRLEYEAFEELAVKEGDRIVGEALRRFPIKRASCLHRLGALGLGDMAVWVGVSSAHRAEAFDACRFIIDEVKHRMPIWKKEHYRNGDSGWVNCERCATAPQQAHTHAHSDAESMQPDYSRQVLLKEIGASGQAALARARVLVVGLGGLGSPVLQYLAGAGVGHLGLIDGDALDASNLHRQPLYGLADVGMNKAELARAAIAALNPAVQVDIHPGRLTGANALELIRAHGVVVDCSDNFATQYLINDAAVLARRPAVFASVYQYEGQLQVYKPEPRHACLRCLWPDAIADGVVGNCAEAGVLGPVPGALGSLQALLTLKILMGMAGQLDGELLLLDFMNFSQLKIKALRRAECRAPDCAHIQELPRHETQIEVAFASLSAAAERGLDVVDIRTAEEFAARPSAARHIPMPQLLGDAKLLDSAREVLLVCASGKRSLAAARELRIRGVAAHSLIGGLQKLDQI